jgi:SAF domain
VSRHARRSILLALLGVVLAGVGLARLTGGGGHAAAAARVQRLFVIRPVASNARITAADLGTERLPAGRASEHQLSRPAQAIGRRTAVALSAGSPLMDAELMPAPQVGGAARAVAVRLDDSAGIPSGDLTDARADVYVTTPGRRGRSRLVLQNVVVLSAARPSSGAVATLLLPAAAVPAAIAAEAEGSLRLVVHLAGGLSR